MKRQHSQDFEWFTTDARTAHPPKRYKLNNSIRGIKKKKVKLIQRTLFRSIKHASLFPNSSYSYTFLHEPLLSTILASTPTNIPQNDTDIVYERLVVAQRIEQAAPDILVEE
jgi:hypothetical protein